MVKDGLSSIHHEMISILCFYFEVKVDEEVVLDVAESIMEALDNDGDGEITKVF